ncbi:AcfA family outer membrane beta-barrel protein [Vibrio mediterranei]|uniref:AcfA family outer membrane beta-barrel protein n=1 Tax=Vibrio mediterranei TaxID=689 RepID=UPI0038CE8100
MTLIKIKYLTLFSLLVSLPVFSSPYVSIGYGVGISKNNFDSNFSEKKYENDDTESFGVFNMLIGYEFNDRYSLELGYSKYNIIEDSTTTVNSSSIYLPLYRHEESIGANQISLSPVLQFPLSRNISLMLKAGVTFTSYSIQYKRFYRQESLFDDDIYRETLLNTNTKEKKEVGGIAAIALAYHLSKNVSLVGGATYQKDSYASYLSALLNVSYRF